MYFVCLGSKKGASTFIPIAMLTAAISTFLFVSNASLQRRQKQLIEAEKKYYVSQLEQKLRGALRDPQFFNEAFVDFNSSEEKSLGLAEVLSSRRLWLGRGARLSFPKLEPCFTSKSCPIKSYLKVESLGGDPSLGLLRFVLRFETDDPIRTGHYNPEKSNSRVEAIVPTGYRGLSLEKSRFYCKDGFAIHFLSAPPLEVICRPL